mmetsp:Transcript_12999/g.23569  ORF Transcript_12999/g.23569 Transcript_12999/m.23569 type:complete len:359 (+) Transcript_12999:3058-4134(+)
MYKVLDEPADLRRVRVVVAHRRADDEQQRPVAKGADHGRFVDESFSDHPQRSVVIHYPVEDMQVLVGRQLSLVSLLVHRVPENWDRACFLPGRDLGPVFPHESRVGDLARLYSLAERSLVYGARSLRDELMELALLVLFELRLDERVDALGHVYKRLLRIVGGDALAGLPSFLLGGIDIHFSVVFDVGFVDSLCFLLEFLFAKHVALLVLALLEVGGIAEKHDVFILVERLEIRLEQKDFFRHPDRLLEAGEVDARLLLLGVYVEPHLDGRVVLLVPVVDVGGGVVHAVIVEENVEFGAGMRHLRVGLDWCPPGRLESVASLGAAVLMLFLGDSRVGEPRHPQAHTLGPTIAQPALHV